MRISYQLWCLNGGGAERAATPIIAALLRCGHQVELTAYVPGDRRALPGIESLGIPYRLLASSKRGLLRALPAQISRLRRRRPDLIITSLSGATIIGQLLGRLLGVPVVSWQHSACLSPTTRFLLGLTHRLTHRWIADCTSVADFLHTEFGIAEDRIHRWPLFEADSSWTLDTPVTDTITIGTMGRLHPIKGIDHLLETARRLRERDPGLFYRTRFLIAGSGPAAAELKQRATTLGLARVEFVGYQECARSFLTGLDIYFQPSLQEGLCIAALQAMQIGLPVVASAVGGLRENIHHGINGFLCEPGDTDAYVDAIRQLGNNPEGRRHLGAIGRRQVLETYPSGCFQACAETLCRQLSAELSLPDESAAAVAADRTTETDQPADDTVKEVA